MIRINLLKSFSSGGADNFANLASGSDRDQLIKEVVKRLVVIVLGPVALYIYEGQAIPELQKKLASANAEFAETTAFNQSKSGLDSEIRKYEEEQAKINLQMNFINKIARDKINEFKLFKHLYSSTPESVWITRLEFRDNVLSIDTESDVPEELNKFSVRLSNADFLSKIIPTTQSYQIDPFGIGVNTTSQSLKAEFNSDSAGQ